MNLQKRLDTWVNATLINQNQADQILKFEEEQVHTSWILFGITTLGVIAIISGIVSVIAANWESINDFTKLSVYFLLLLGFAAAAFKWASGDIAKIGTGKKIVRECILLGFALYLMAGIGLIGQVFNLQSDGYSAVFFWLVITLPVTVLVEKSLLGHLWCFGLVYAMCSWGIDTHDYAHHVITVSVPFYLLGLSYLLAPYPSEQFCRVVRLWCYATLLIPLAIIGNVYLASGSSMSRRELVDAWQLVLLLGFIVAIVGALLRRTIPGKIVTYGIVTTLCAAFFLTIIPLNFHIPRYYHQGYPTLGGFLFLLAWVGIAVVAAATHRKRLFDLTTLVIGIRFIWVYFEIFGSLAASGFGLIITGLIILAAAYTWHKYRRNLAEIISRSV